MQSRPTLAIVPLSVAPLALVAYPLDATTYQHNRQRAKWTGLLDLLRRGLQSERKIAAVHAVLTIMVGGVLLGVSCTQVDVNDGASKETQPLLEAAGRVYRPLLWSGGLRIFGEALVQSSTAPRLVCLVLQLVMFLDKEFIAITPL